MRRRLTLGIVTCALAAGFADAPLAAQRVERRQQVEGIRIERVDQEDGGTLIRFVRRGPGFRFEYYLEFWRGNGGVVTGALFRRGDCRTGDASMIQPYESGLSRESLDARLADYLRGCPLGAGRESALRRQLDAAWPVFSAWAQEALAEVHAENEAIVNHGRAE